jgi:site-specific recombinase XerD
MESSLVQAPLRAGDRLQALRRLVVDAMHSPNSKAAYGHALTDFLGWYATHAPGEVFSKAVVQRWMAFLETRGLAASSVNLRLCAVRRLAAEAVDNGFMDPTLAHGIARCKGIKRAGVRSGNWLTRAQAEALLVAPNTTRLKGKRDRALLAVLIGCGLRRAEASALTLEHIQQRDGRWVIVDLIGKGQRIRSVPMPAWCKAVVDVWTEAAGLTAGLVFRSMNNKGELAGGPLLPQNVMDVVVHYAAKIEGLGKLAPHDLRRTFAKLAHTGHAALEQIQLSLGHASIQTTERYLGVSQDLIDAPCDHLGIRLQV